MVRHHGRAHRRAPASGGSRKAVILAAVFFLVAAGLFVRYGKHLHPPYYEGILIAGDPVTVITRERESNRLNIITLPSDVWIGGTRGYGRYSLAALWKLGRIDRTGGALITESVSEALKVPIISYIGKNDDRLEQGERGLPFLKSLFTYRHIAGFMVNRYTTDLDFIDFIRMTLYITLLSEADVKNIALGIEPYVRSDTLADGTPFTYLDTQILDHAFGSELELDNLKKERISVAVFNATDVPGLGELVAGKLSRMGVLVVSVGNTDERTGACRISAGEDAKDSTTVRFLQEVLSCTGSDTDTAGRADITITVGDDYAERFRKK